MYIYIAIHILFAYLITYINLSTYVCECVRYIFKDKRKMEYKM